MARTASTAKKRTRSRTTKRGRPTKCTPAVIAGVTARVRAGLGKEAACRKMGVAAATMREWVARGVAGEQPYAEFLRGVEGASDDLQEEVSTALLDALRDVDRHDLRTRTAMWLGERLWPDVYGRRSETRLSGPDGGPVQVAADVKVQPFLTADVAAGLDGEQLAALAREFMAKG